MLCVIETPLFLKRQLARSLPYRLVDGKRPTLLLAELALNASSDPLGVELRSCAFGDTQKFVYSSPSIADGSTTLSLSYSSARRTLFVRADVVDAAVGRSVATNPSFDALRVYARDGVTDQPTQCWQVSRAGVVAVDDDAECAADVASALVFGTSEALANGGVRLYFRIDNINETQQNALLFATRVTDADDAALFYDSAMFSVTNGSSSPDYLSDDAAKAFHATRLRTTLDCRSTTPTKKPTITSTTTVGNSMNATASVETATTTATTTTTILPSTSSVGVVGATSADGLPTSIIGGAAGGGVLLLALVVVLLACCVARRRRRRRADERESTPEIALKHSDDSDVGGRYTDPRKRPNHYDAATINEPVSYDVVPTTPYDVVPVKMQATYDSVPDDAAGDKVRF